MLVCVHLTFIACWSACLLFELVCIWLLTNVRFKVIILNNSMLIDQSSSYMLVTNLYYDK